MTKYTVALAFPVTCSSLDLSATRNDVCNAQKTTKKTIEFEGKRAACSKKEGDGYDRSYFLDSNETEHPSPNNKPLFIRYLNTNKDCLTIPRLVA